MDNITKWDTIVKQWEVIKKETQRLDEIIRGGELTEEEYYNLFERNQDQQFKYGEPPTPDESEMVEEEIKTANLD